MGVEIVELRAAGAHLQPVDAAVAPVVGDHDVIFTPMPTAVASSEFIIM